MGAPALVTAFTRLRAIPVTLLSDRRPRRHRSDNQPAAPHACPPALKPIPGP